eukprot:CAMPEP_0201492568 /NCGR_PEP_ID=MMETSP0151_2-20130828/33701_1 /ASSEMBLY_ACC=CAM_ASM_000257 /TAXON_ID=200890 /ORGANISM="Paramoeba atlantica, Strain 621/1 / CCAP 1560/9" /LENGTH=405 /DNA_ID=CAMNT_0047879449 /DNA_START=23 /DNA_END=1240 /DNA_ORIENTATION=+
MAEEASPGLKEIQKYLDLAEQLEQFDPKASYHCRFYFMQKGCKLSSEHPSDVPLRRALEKELQKLEETKDQFGNREDGLECVATVALKIFKHANGCEEKGEKSEQVSRDYMTASDLLDVCRQFAEGNLSPEHQKIQKTAKWRAVEVLKEMKQPKPAGGPPQQDLNFPAAPSADLSFPTPPSGGNTQQPPGYSNGVGQHPQFPNAPHGFPNAPQGQQPQFPNTPQGNPQFPNGHHPSSQPQTFGSDLVFPSPPSVGGSQPQQPDPFFPTPPSSSGLDFPTPPSGTQPPSSDFGLSFPTPPSGTQQKAPPAGGKQVLPTAPPQYQPPPSQQPPAAQPPPSQPGVGGTSGFNYGAYPVSKPKTGNTSDKDLETAHKYAKQAASALQFDDVPTAISKLEAALELLKKKY